MTPYIRKKIKQLEQDLADCRQDLRESQGVVLLQGRLIQYLKGRLALEPSLPVSPAKPRDSSRWATK